MLHCSHSAAEALLALKRCCHAAGVQFSFGGAASFSFSFGTSSGGWRTLSTVPLLAPSKPLRVLHTHHIYSVGWE
jgi:hypothetical protein